MNAIKYIVTFLLLALFLSGCATTAAPKDKPWRDAKTPRPSSSSKTQSDSPDTKTPRPSKEPSPKPEKPDPEDKKWMDELDIDKIHKLNIDSNLELDGNIEQDGEVWYAIKPQQTAKYELVVFPDYIHDYLSASVYVYNNEMMPVIPESNGIVLNEGTVYYIRVEFEDVTSPQQFEFIVIAAIDRLSDYWNYQGDLTEETPGYWFVLFPEMDGKYNFGFEQDSKAVTFSVYEKDEKMKKLRLDTDDNIMLEYGKVYFIEVKTKSKDFYLMPYTITIQVFNDEDDEIYPDDEDYDYDSYNPNEFDYDNQDDTDDDLIPEGDYAG